MKLVQEVPSDDAVPTAERRKIDANIIDFFWVVKMLCSDLSIRDC